MVINNPRNDNNNINIMLSEGVMDTKRLKDLLYTPSLSMKIYLLLLVRKTDYY